MIATFIIVFFDVFGVWATLPESCSGLFFLSLVLLTIVCAPLLVRFCQNINPLYAFLDSKATHFFLRNNCSKICCFHLCCHSLEFNLSQKGWTNKYFGQNLLYFETIGSSDNYFDRFSRYPNRFLRLFSCQTKNTHRKSGLMNNIRINSY